MGERLGPQIHRQWVRSDLDGVVYAQPLLVANAVIVATEGDSLYRLDAATGAVRWRAQLGRPVAGGDLPCGDIDPSGITGTPVVDTSTGLVWVVAFVQPGRHELVAVDLATGAVRDRRPVDPPGADPTVEQQRAALTLANGRVYVPYGGLYGDCGAYHGWVVASPARLGGPPPGLLSWQVPTGREGGIWAPPGASVDAAGDLFVVTGNSASRSAYDQGNTVVRLSPDLRELDTFAPSDWADLNRGDIDLGSVGPTLAGAGLVFQVGKAGVGYLLDAGHLGGIGGEVFQGPVCPGSGAFEATAWVPPLILVPCTAGLVAVRVAGRAFSVAWRGPRFGAGPPAVSDGVAWTVDLSGGDLVGLDLATGAVRARAHVGAVPHFAPVAIGAGRLVVPSHRGVVAFGG